jgi:hypothetical protein
MAAMVVVLTAACSADAEKEGIESYHADLVDADVAVNCEHDFCPTRRSEKQGNAPTGRSCHQAVREAHSG